MLGRDLCSRCSHRMTHTVMQSGVFIVRSISSRFVFPPTCSRFPFRARFPIHLARDFCVRVPFPTVRIGNAGLEYRNAILRLKVTMPIFDTTRRQTTQHSPILDIHQEVNPRVALENALNRRRSSYHNLETVVDPEINSSLRINISSCSSVF